MRRAWLLLALLPLALGDCARGGDENVITFWHAMGRWEPQLLEIVDAYNALHPEMPVRAYNMSRYQALSQKIIAAVAAGQPPTISQAYEAWTSEMMAGGVIECLQPYADGAMGVDGLSEADWSDFRPVFLDECRYPDANGEGQLWSFPFNKSVRTLFYNRDLFAELGLDPERPPRNWDEWRDYSARISADLDGDGRNDRWGSTARASVTVFGNLLLQDDGDFFSADGSRCTIAEPPGVEAMTFMRAMFGERTLGYATFDYAYQNEFKAGKVGMMEGSSVSLSFLRGILDFELGVAPLPGKKRDVALIQGTNLVLFKRATDAQKRGAWEFIRFLTDTANATRWSIATGYAPLRRSCMEQPAMQELLAATPGLEAAYGQLETARSEPRNAAWFAGRKYLEEGAIQRVMRGTAAPAEALRATARKIDAEIASEF
ncbi:MAG: ABC transporter substrate-binding protein [Candidatus Latescibacteria bacterium]|nr:ABC transporter substrate-binding protein [Candidatus Latescibacterota bacterium]